MFASGCQFLGYFDQAPPDRCEVPGRQEQLPCGPCLHGLQLRVCGQNFLWHREGACLDNPYDVDQDGYANELCFDEEDADCCGEADCDDTTAERYPGHGDVDRDEHIDVRCGGDDCDDDNDDLWNGHADRDGDGYNDVACGGIDCDDFNDERWNGHADVDGDGHTDLRCCTEDSPLCDDCNDDDLQRWLNHADLDWDGHDDIDCCDADGECGDDCDDTHPQRWMGHADVDGDGHVDDRCCPDCEQERLDCNDNDPRRWTGNSDLDGDGRHDMRCRCPNSDSTRDCSLFDDCDDDCEECFKRADRRLGPGRDHDCDSVVDELEAPCIFPLDPCLIGSVDTGDSIALSVSGQTVFVGSTDGLYEVDASIPELPAVVRHLDIGHARDVEVYGELVGVATATGLVIVSRAGSELVRLSGPLDMGDSRAVSFASTRAYVATVRGLFVVDMSYPSAPVVLASVTAPVLWDVQDVRVGDWERAVAIGRSSEVGSTDVVGMYSTDHEGVLHGLHEGLVELACPRAVDLGGANREGDTTCVVTCLGLATLHNITFSLSHLEPLEGARSVFVANTISGVGQVYVATNDGVHYFEASGGFDHIGFIEAGPVADLFVLEDVMYLATERGLQVVSLDCSS